MKQQLLLLILLLSLAFTSNAQVTIGSSEKPIFGVLLYLQESYSDVNPYPTKGGLLMPRVQLTNLNQIVGTISGVTSENADYHIGLTVFNVNRCLNNNADADGLYHWDGDMWQRVGEKSLAASVKIFEDPRDGEKYKYRTFGGAGTWMLENLRATKTSGGVSLINQIGGVTAAKERFYTYPNIAGTTDGTNSAIFTKQPKLGLLYNWYAATNNENNAILAGQDQVSGIVPGVNEVESKALNGYIQGICPTGWHLPSDREWNMLEKELYDYPQLYSNYAADEVFAPAKWDATWETALGWRGSTSVNGHTLVMVNHCAPLDAPLSSTRGRSLLSAKGGFDGALAGISTVAVVVSGSFVEYNYSLHCWASSSTSETIALYRAIVPRVNVSVLRTRQVKTSFFSVRCKKD